ncbi:hypothetical protein [Thermosulfurimonas dismutans]|uniref:hypothetical protein n=1 Tax=Thermosulfurimonas dismutans TaxID=999894 RepID=UPI00083913B9|nr:hypothetical protein [Thermosulfurimonas dismutans]
MGKRRPTVLHVTVNGNGVDGSEEQHNRVRRGTDLRRIKENLRILKYFCGPQVLARDFLSRVRDLLYRKGLSSEALYFPYGYLSLFTDVVP